MPLINNDGRLFGVINVIDLMAVFFVAALLPFGYFGYRLHVVRQGQIVRQEQATERRFTTIAVRFIQVMPEVLKIVHMGDTDRIEPSVLLSVVDVRPWKYVFQQDERVWYAEHPTMKEVVMQLRVPCYWDGELLRYRGSPLRVGSRFHFETPYYALEGSVISVEWPAQAAVTLP